MLRRFLAIGSLIVSGAAWGQSGPVVKAPAGAVRGVQEDDVLSFKGVPYARPPIGRLRWRAPETLPRWKGIRAANRMGALCEQKFNAGDNGVGPLPMSEDCLTLNIFAPRGAKRLPVMFWIHGGGFVNGSGTAALYDGSALARQGVLVVTINYRLGRFGFFAHPALSAEAAGRPVANYGVMDMLAALRWVRTNIAAFGGDAGAVTIFGESAGGAAVNHLMASPMARGMFQRAIVQSGLGRETMLSLADAEKAGQEFANSMGAESVDELRALDAGEILARGDPDIISGGGPIVDGHLLTMSPMEAFRSGREAMVPYVVGWNSLEFPVPATLGAARLTSGAGRIATAALSKVKAAYPDAASYEHHLLSDAIFVEPAVTLASLHAGRGQPTWVYQFSVLPKAAPAALKGTPHALERQYVFNTLKTSPFPVDGNDGAQAVAVNSYWAAFGRTGNPNAGSRVNWPNFGEGGRLLDFTNEGPVVAPAPRAVALSALAEAHGR